MERRESEAVTAERPEARPACGGAGLIRSGHACGRQRWRCKGCGRRFTRTTPRGKPAAVKHEAVGLHCAGLSLNAIGKRLGVSAQSVMRWIRDHARHHCPKPEPAGRASVVELDEVWHFVKKGQQALDLEGPRARHRPADCGLGWKEAGRSSPDGPVRMLVHGRP
jgi:transposase-like protein